MAAGLGGGGASLASQFANAATGGIGPMIRRSWSNAPQRAVNRWQDNLARRAEARAAGGTLYNNLSPEIRHEARSRTSHPFSRGPPSTGSGDRSAQLERAPVPTT